MKKFILSFLALAFFAAPGLSQFAPPAPATSNTLGVVQPDNSTTFVDPSGKIHATTGGVVTNVTYITNVTKISTTNLTVVSNEYVNYSIITNVTIVETANLPANTKLTNAEVFGAMIFENDAQEIGDEAGTLSFFNPTSTQFNFGGSSLGATDGTINAGTVSASSYTGLPVATTGEPGIMQVGSGLSVIAGIVSTSGGSQSTWTMPQNGGGQSLTNTTNVTVGGLGASVSNVIGSNYIATVSNGVVISMMSNGVYYGFSATSTNIGTPTNWTIITGTATNTANSSSNVITVPGFTNVVTADSMYTYYAGSPVAYTGFLMTQGAARIDVAGGNPNGGANLGLYNAGNEQLLIGSGNSLVAIAPFSIEHGGANGAAFNGIDWVGFRNMSCYGNFVCSNGYGFQGASGVNWTQSTMGSNGFFNTSALAFTNGPQRGWMTVPYNFTTSSGGGWGIQVYITNYSGPVAASTTITNVKAWGVGNGGLTALTQSGSNVLQFFVYSNSMVLAIPTAGTITWGTSTNDQSQADWQ